MTKQIKLLDGSVASQDWLIEQARDDNYYYNVLGKVAFSSSIVGTLLNSPKSYYYNTKYGQGEESPALTLGKAIHCKALTPELYDTDFEVIDVASKNTKKYKEAAEASSKICLTKVEADKTNRVVDALLRNEAFLQRLTNSETELPMVDNIFGFPFRAKADILKGNILYDLKTTSDLKAFPFSAKKYNYDSQAFIYCTMFGVPRENFEFFVVDKSSLDIGIYTVSEESFERGRQKVEYALDLYTNFFAGKEEDEILSNLDQYHITGEI